MFLRVNCVSSAHRTLSVHPAIAAPTTASDPHKTKREGERDVSRENQEKIEYSVRKGGVSRRLYIFY